MLPRVALKGIVDLQPSNWIDMRRLAAALAALRADGVWAGFFVAEVKRSRASSR